jgi:large subunit ribosomal protein L16
MLNIPKNIRFRKTHKGRLHGLHWKKKTSILYYGSFGIKVLEIGNITKKQIETARRVIANKTKRIAKLWLRVFLYKGMTKKSKGARMGKGVGGIKFWVFKVKPGLILFEIDGIKEKTAKVISRVINSRLPVKVKLVVNNKSLV